MLCYGILSQKLNESTAIDPNGQNPKSQLRGQIHAQIPAHILKNHLNSPLNLQRATTKHGTLHKNNEWNRKGSKREKRGRFDYAEPWSDGYWMERCIGIVMNKEWGQKSSEWCWKESIDPSSYLISDVCSNGNRNSFSAFRKLMKNSNNQKTFCPYYVVYPKVIAELWIISDENKG